MSEKKIDMKDLAQYYPVSNLTDYISELESQLAILRKALENIDNEEIAEFDHIYQIKTFKRVVSDALKKCFGESGER